MHDHMLDDDRKPQRLKCYEGMVYMLVAVPAPHTLGVDDADCEDMIAKMTARGQKQLLGQNIATGDYEIVAFLASTREPGLR